MGSETTFKVPVIDFSKQELKPGTPEWDMVKLQVRKALEEYGCFEASLDKILEIRKPLFGAMKELFDLPLQTKQLLGHDQLFRGYVGHAQPWFESVVIDDANVAENIEKHLTSILWPQGNSSFNKTLLSYMELASGLEKTIRRMILESFGLEKYIDEHMDLTNYCLRALKYIGRSQIDEMSSTLTPHYDKNLVTVLHQDDINGLQVQTKDGEWIDVIPSPNSFIVLIGESLTVWLNGRLPSPYHRVRVAENKTRYMAGMFATPKGGFKIKVHEELVDEHNPLLFKPFDYNDYMESFFHSKAGRAGIGSTLQDYCRV